MKQDSLEIVSVAIDELKPADYNPRHLDEHDRVEIKKSLEKYGFVDAVTVNKHEGRENIIIGGHQRVKVAKEDLGYTHVPCVYVDLDFDDEKELNIRLNKNGGKFDEELLKKFFDKDFLLHVGFKKSELSFYLDEFEKKFNAITNKNCEMPIVPMFSEKYDALIIISTNVVDTTFLKTTFNVEKSQSYKCSRTGEAMVVTVEHIKAALGI